jgi:hypothetical protein
MITSPITQAIVRADVEARTQVETNVAVRAPPPLPDYLEQNLRLGVPASAGRAHL